MNWKKLFTRQILERGHDYYCNNAIENLDIEEDMIAADVTGSECYEVEICLSDGEVTDMSCSCPYAEGGRNCKHMAAVLYKWHDMVNEEDGEMDTAVNTELSEHVFSTNSNKKKKTAVEALVANAEDKVVRSFLISALAENEKLLLRFYNTVNKKVTKEDVKKYIRQIDRIANRYLGRDRFINYYEAGSFISELEDLLDQDVRPMAGNGNYLSAFEVMNYIFVLLGEVDMDDSDGGTGSLADNIYQLWVELLASVNAEDKKKMFDWFTDHLDGSVIDYLEEYIEQIILEEFEEKEYVQAKLTFIEKMIQKSEEEDSEWSRNYRTGKWAARYLAILEENKAPEQQLEEVCEKYWHNSSVRKYYMDMCMEKKDYDRVLQILDESIELDKQYRGLITDYNRKKKEIYLLQGNKKAYVEQLWKLALDFEAGEVETFKELKEQYTAEEWLVRREEIFKKLPAYAHVERLYKEEKLYDRLLTCVINSPGLHALQEYEKELKEEYPEQILDKYQDEVNKMAVHTGARKHYSDLVSLLRRMQKMEGGAKCVDKIIEAWKVTYRNRPAMMDELRKL